MDPVYPQTECRTKLARHAHGVLLVRDGVMTNYAIKTVQVEVLNVIVN